MRNLFDQYSQPENRLTHALACALEHDRSLVRPFLRWLGVQGVPPIKGVRIAEQQMPGIATPRGEDERRGLPDIAIFDDEDWAVLIESKVQAKLTADQIRRHHRTAQRYGYPKPQIVCITVDQPGTRLPRDVIHVMWRDVYAWFNKQRGRSLFVSQLVGYMQVFESQMIDIDYSIRGTITMFDGIRFDEDNPYSYREAKRLIRLLGDELQQRRDLHTLGVDPKGERRSAITGSSDIRVWDFLPLRAARGAASFTHHPHLTMDIAQTQCGAAITIPHGIKGGFRWKLADVGVDGFTELLTDTYHRLKPVLKQSRGAKPWVYIVQRHYPSQRSSAVTDGRLGADMRTFIRGANAQVKYQPQWIKAVYELLNEKRSNIQLGVVVEFQYSCPIIRSPRAPDLIARSWIAMKPLLQFASSK